jgi:uncharacterized membrane protein
MKRINLRKTLSAVALIGAPIVTAIALADTPQGGYGPGNGMGPGMMNGYGYGWMGGYGGIWLPILVVIAVAALVVWVVNQKKKR